MFQIAYAGDDIMAKSKNSEIKDWVLHILAAVVIALLIVTFVGQITIVSKSSMTPTLKDGDRLIIEKLTKYFGSYNRGDIVVLYYPECLESGDLIIKRIIGLEGDLVEIKDGDVYVNGEYVAEDYIRGTYTYEVNESYSSVKVPEGSVYVLGDNREANGSIDSRTFGALQVTRIRGKAIFRLFPFNKFGMVK